MTPHRQEIVWFLFSSRFSLLQEIPSTSDLKTIPVREHFHDAFPSWSNLIDRAIQYRVFL
jgi:hypothetical protein